MAGPNLNVLSFFNKQTHWLSHLREGERKLKLSASSQLLSSLSLQTSPSLLMLTQETHYIFYQPEH